MSAADKGDVVVGIDLGGTKVRAGIGAADGTVLHEITQPTRGGAALVTQLASIVDSLADACGDVRVIGTAIGGAGVPDGRSGQFELAPNLGELHNFSLAGELETLLGHPVVLDNDVNIAAIGELHAGIGRQIDTFAFLAVGTGIGVGLVLDGRLWRGVSGAAGEVGYLPLGTDPLDPVNQRRGPLEECVAGDALVARYRELSGKTGERIRAHDVFDRADAAEPAAVKALDDEARWIAHVIHAIEVTVDPGIFVLGGGIGSRTELLAPIRSWLSRLGRPSTKLQVSSLGASAPIIGGIRLALDAASQNATQKEDAHE